jgi:hypothetical protein
MRKSYIYGFSLDVIDKRIIGKMWGDVRGKR